MTIQRNAEGKAPLAFSSLSLKPADGDCLVLVLRSDAWFEEAVEDVIKALSEMEVRFVILYLDADDEAHVVRKSQ